MSLSDHPRVYGTAALTVAFLAGVLVTLGFKDLYPELEARYQRRKKRYGSRAGPEEHRGSFLFGPVTLEDREDSVMLARSCDIVDGIEGTIGNTPLVRIRSLSEATGCEILAKAEFLNGAGGSPKDRVALSMIQAAEEQGLLSPGRGDTIYEGTVGSTGISLAVLARARGYKCHICMPDDMAIEKSDLLHHLGATVERVPPAPITDPGHFVNLARTRAKQHTASDSPSRGFFADQFESQANYTAHVRTTGPEIYAQTRGQLDAFVAGAGTGGTISGVARYLKLEAGLTSVRVVLADPQGSGLYNKIRYGVMYSSTEKEGTRRRHQVDTMVEGIGINRITENFEAGRSLIDDAVRVTDEQACKMARWLVEHDGIFIGSSSAVNCVAAVVTAMKLPKGSRVVTILCDSGTRHLSKFWKHIAAMGLEGDKSDEQQREEDLFEVLGINKNSLR
ncbi:cysteine synthase-like protein [Thermochaetoides thermophila DSM 1495]|mgnify:CR=1 FL=1|uniref:Cysteine synthase 2 n=1 Tax=Chaetomium thermophilum (strain DSM 1495 / CBS 144.50 / IMI 039719) TaxID=759272 RepID=G0SF56_CHATD|nr:cysteine synthase-like protein [Thermochaetoides thermophila DSM 1495]EGS18072.1 cysteine synthase-like protein [Thermochaetoides thermophila DSM 1495]